MEPDIPVSHTACHTPNKGLHIAASEVPLSTVEIIVASAVSLPVLIEGTMVVEGVKRVIRYAVKIDLSTSSERVSDFVHGKKDATHAVQEAQRATCYTLEGDSATLSEVGHGLVEVELEKGKEVAPGCGTAVNQCEIVRLVVENVVLMNAGKVSVPQWGRRALIVGGHWVLDFSWGGFYV